MFVIFILILLPFCISMVYNFFYSSHINKQISAEYKKSWLSPFSIFIITLLIEFLILVILFFIFGVNPYSNKDSFQEEALHMSEYSLYTESEVDNSIYSIFNGNDVKGYIKKTGAYDDSFTYILYICDYSVSSYPKYVLITDYTGDKSYIGEETTVFITQVDSSGSMQNMQISGTNEGAQVSDRLYHIIEPGEYQFFNISMYLFDKDLNINVSEVHDWNTTEDFAKKNAVAEFSIGL